MITLSKEVFANISADGAACYPEECCGIIFGTINENGDKTAHFAEPVENGFEQRYALVTLLDYYVNSDHIDRLLRLLAAVETLTPQAEDALAWAYQTCFLGFQQKTFFALRALKVEKESFNRMLDRILTCTRFNETQQQVLLTLRRP